MSIRGRDGTLTIDFLNVGQGESIYIKFPGGANMLVDCGTVSSRKVGRPSLEPLFQKLDVLDYLVFTHADKDHYNLFEGLMREFSVNVKNLLIGGDERDYKLNRKRRKNSISTIVEIQKDLGPVPAPRPKRRRRGEPVNLMKVSNTGVTRLEDDRFGGVEVNILAAQVPASGKDRKDNAWKTNTGSVCIQLTYQERRVMLTGDATRDTEAHMLKLIAADRLKSDVLKGQHHGSIDTSFSPAWVKAVQPEYVIFSAGQHRHKHPREAAIQVIRANTTLKTVETHTYASYYRERDLTTFNKNHPPPLAQLRWQEKVRNMFGRPQLYATDEAIYTTLGSPRHDATLGELQNDPLRSWELTIDAKGAIAVQGSRKP